MRVALFFDGKNFYSGWRETCQGKKIDFQKLGSWLVERVGGQHLWGASYYTGIEIGNTADSESQLNLDRFLNELEMLPGYFVQRFPRKRQAYRCHSCGELNRYTQEKEVDTTMVADMLRLAAVDAFDILVLVSGDRDHAPAVEGVRSLGKQVYVASWGGFDVAKRLRKTAFDHVDLLDGVNQFQFQETGSHHDSDERSASVAASSDAVHQSAVSNEQPASMTDIFVEELKQAEIHFKDGYVGLNYFIRSWKSPRLESSSELRSQWLDDLIEAGRVETYEAEDGSKALRCCDEDDHSRETTTVEINDTVPPPASPDGIIFECGTGE